MAVTESSQILASWREKVAIPAPALWILQAVLLSCLIGYSFIGAASVAVTGARLMNNSWENTHPEGPHIYAAIEGARTGRLYSPFTQSPYVIQSYGPLYYAVNAAIARASHLDVAATVLNARLLSYFCYLLCGVMAFAITTRVGASLLLSLLSALMMIGNPDVASWNATARPDLLFLAAMLVSLYLLVSAGEQDWFLYAFAGVFAAIAFLIKQPGIAVAITGFGVLVVKKEYRKAALFGAGAAIPALAFLAYMIRHEPFFLQQFTSVGKGYWSLWEGVRFVATKFAEIVHFVPLCIGGLGFAWALKKDWKMQAIAWFAVVNWVVEISGLPQLGSGINYFLPGLAGCALLLPGAVDFIRENMRSAVFHVLAGAALIWACYTGVIGCAFTTVYYRAPQQMSYAALRPYRIISDISLLSLYGHDPDLLDSFAVHSLELKGNWSSDPVVQNIRRGEYDLILLPRVRFTRTITSYRGISDYAPSVIQALNENYTVLCSTMKSMVLKPRDREIDLSPAYFGEMFGVKCGTGLANKSPGLLITKGAL
jgi:hypothetical protein